MSISLIIYIKKTYLKNTESKNNPNSSEILDSSRKLMIFVPLRNKTVNRENHFPAPPLWKYVRTVAKSMRKQEAMLITV